MGEVSVAQNRRIDEKMFLIIAMTAAAFLLSRQLDKVDHSLWYHPRSKFNHKL